MALLPAHRSIQIMLRTGLGSQTALAHRNSAFSKFNANTCPLSLAHILGAFIGEEACVSVRRGLESHHALLEQWTDGWILAVPFTPGGSLRHLPILLELLDILKATLTRIGWNCHQRDVAREPAEVRVPLLPTPSSRVQVELL